LSLGAKVLSLLLLWGAMGLTMLLFVSDPLIIFIMAVIGLAVSLHILLLKGR
jgi:hypothetical protein